MNAMDRPYTRSIPLPRLELWERLKNRRVPLSFELELTARCNNHCRHCFINLPCDDDEARAREMSAAAILDIADRAVALGAMWCLLTGGEPLLRDDFEELYRVLKQKGLLISLFTNATLIDERHIRLLRRYPPRDIEVTVYGASDATYARVTRNPGGFEAFRRGLRLLEEAGLKVRLKAMALRSNYEEMGAIARFCRAHTKDYFRFDPLLHLRYDRNPRRNREILSERLSPEEVVALETADPQRSESLRKNCDKLLFDGRPPANGMVFYCGAGNSSFTVGWDGRLRLCASLCRPDCVYDPAGGSLDDFWNRFIPAVRQARSARPSYIERCHTCPLINLCYWCPAHADLETGELDLTVESFCAVAQARQKMLQSPSPALPPDAAR
jgi:radical SAM protein with 4Fe4S-binding SPASM domain